MPSCVTKALLTLLLLIAANSSLAAQKEILNEKNAQLLLKQKIDSSKLYEAWGKWECLHVATDINTTTYFEFTIREHHKGGCPGDPLTAPRVDSFRVYRKTHKILWYSISDGNFVAFSEAIKYRNQKKQKKSSQNG